MKLIKKFFRMLTITILSILCSVTIFLLSFGLILFFSPTLIINVKNLDYALSTTDVLKSWSWKSGYINHKWNAWNNREFSGEFVDLCLFLDKPGTELITCMEKVAWNINIKWKLKEGVSFLVNQPLMIRSNNTVIKLVDHQKKKKRPGPDIFTLWNRLWLKGIPDLDFKFNQINLYANNNYKKFDLKIKKTKKELWAQTMGFSLYATPRHITVTAPRKIKLPYDLKTRNPLFFEAITLNADINKTNIGFFISGQIESAKLFYRSELLKNELKNIEVNNLIKKILIRGHGELEILKLVSSVKKIMKPPYHILPAPINAMEGSVKVKMISSLVDHSPDIKLHFDTAVDFAGAGQFLIMNILTHLPLNLETKKIGSIMLELDFKKVLLRLPQLSRKSLPPQFKPDPRIKANVVAKDTTKKGKKVKQKISTDITLEALGAKALQIKTNLLDEVLRLNFNLNIGSKEVINGFITAFPLRTKVFKRPVHLLDLRIDFNTPLEPNIKSTIEFNLPDYVVTLKVKGPISEPRTAFSSKPPLSEDDIIAVLLFGKPLSALSSEDQTATKSAGQLISQGILSLAVLYYFAGSPVESIGYDPDEKTVSAQFGLGKRSSLYVESSRAGKNAIGTYGVRHSLGKGWYIDTSVAERANRYEQGKNMGVLLERIISY